MKGRFAFLIVLMIWTSGCGGIAYPFQWWITTATPTPTNTPTLTSTPTPTNTPTPIPTSTPTPTPTPTPIPIPTNTPKPKLVEKVDRVLKAHGFSLESTDIKMCYVGPCRIYMNDTHDIMGIFYSSSDVFGMVVPFDGSTILPDYLSLVSTMLTEMYNLDISAWVKLNANRAVTQVPITTEIGDFVIMVQAGLVNGIKTCKIYIISNPKENPALSVNG